MSLAHWDFFFLYCYFYWNLLYEYLWYVPNHWVHKTSENNAGSTICEGWLHSTDCKWPIMLSAKFLEGFFQAWLWSWLFQTILKKKQPIDRFTFRYFGFSPKFQNCIYIFLIENCNRRCEVFLHGFRKPVKVNTDNLQLNSGR